MTNKDIKERNVWEFKEFAKAYDEAKKVITLKKGDLAHPGGHVITADPLYYRNDANPYIAAGIEMKEPDQANANSKIMPGAQVIPANEEKEPTDKEIKDATKAATSIVHTSSDAAFTITESNTEALKAEAIQLYFDDVKLEDARERFKMYVEELPIEDHRQDGFYCTYCKKFEKKQQMGVSGSVAFKFDNEILHGRPVAIWLVKKHYDGCRGWE